MKTAHHLHDFGHDFGDPHFKNPPKENGCAAGRPWQAGQPCHFLFPQHLGVEIPSRSAKNMG